MLCVWILLLERISVCVCVCVCALLLFCVCVLLLFCVCVCACVCPFPSLIIIMSDLVSIPFSSSVLQPLTWIGRLVIVTGLLRHFLSSLYVIGRTWRCNSTVYSESNNSENAIQCIIKCVLHKRRLCKTRKYLKPAHYSTVLRNC
jgi:hypothetical protein